MHITKFRIREYYFQRLHVPGSEIENKMQAHSLLTQPLSLTRSDPDCETRAPTASSGLRNKKHSKFVFAFAINTKALPLQPRPVNSASLLLFRIAVIS